MSDSTTTAIAIVGIITGIGSAVALILKNIKHSECCSCCKIDTRTPVSLAPPPHKSINTNTNNKNKNKSIIVEV